MNCRRVTNLLSAYVDGELAGVEMLEIRRHLSECEECTQEYEDVRFTKHALSQLANISPRADFAASISARLDEVTVSPYQKIFNCAVRYAHNRLSPVTAALAAIGVAFVILSAGSVNYSRPQAGYLAPAVQNVAPIKSVAFWQNSYQAPGLDTPQPLQLASYASYSDSATLQMSSLVGK
ncbi:MAG: zf-HC2 domain-containing protein [Acidobacteria bacterium]|nr:zf-HC2 domain-containing protein [Acidobacteriota bacterium]